MPIEAELPDGTILEFPDDTPEAIVQARVREYLNPERRAQLEAALAAEAGAGPSAEPPRLDAQGGTVTPLANPLDSFQPSDEELVRMAAGGVQTLGGAAGTGLGFLKGALGNVRGLADVLLPGQPGSAIIPEGAVTPTTPEQAGGETAANMAAFFIPGGPGLLSKFPAIARAVQKSPWLLKALSSVIEGGKAGGLTAAQGGGGLESTLVGLLGAGGGALGTSAAGVEESARNSLARAVGARLGSAKPVLKVADQALDEGFVGTRGALTRKAEERVAESLAEKEVLEQATTPVDIEPAFRELRRRAGEKTLNAPPIHPELQPEGELERILGMLADPNARSQAMQEMAAKGLTLDDLKQAMAVRVMPTAGDPAMVSGLETEANALEMLSQAYGGRVPLNELVKFSKGRGAQVRRTATGFSEIPGPPQLGVNTAVMKESAGLTKRQIHEVSSDLATADRQHHVYKTLLDALEKYKLSNLTRSQQARFAAYIAGRAAVGGALGGFSGPSESNLLNILGGAGIGLASGFPLTQTVSATFKRALARNIRSGNFEEALHMLEALPALQNRRNLPLPPEE